tara:strand:- start:110 stop:904 length:795 start_codon:yes stop_codon:yes gene_type:complete
MAVSINSVYQKVMALANKEQRGFITPQEFNLLANQAQQDIFEQYFYDLDAAEQEPTKPSVGQVKNTIIKKIEYAINKAIPYVNMVYSNGSFDFPAATTATSSHRVGGVRYLRGGNTYVELVPISREEVRLLSLNTWHRQGPYTGTPITSGSLSSGETAYIINNMDDTISIWDNGAFVTNAAHVQCEAINEADHPPIVNWPFTVVNEQPLYNAGAATLVNFRLHKSEEQELVIKILELAGITINKPGLYQIAAGEEQQHTTTSPK